MVGLGFPVEDEENREGCGEGENMQAKEPASQCARVGRKDRPFSNLQDTKEYLNQRGT